MRLASTVTMDSSGIRTTGTGVTIRRRVVMPTADRDGRIRICLLRSLRWTNTHGTTGACKSLRVVTDIAWVTALNSGANATPSRKRLTSYWRMVMSMCGVRCRRGAWCSLRPRHCIRVFPTALQIRGGRSSAVSTPCTITPMASPTGENRQFPGPIICCWTMVGSTLRAYNVEATLQTR